MDRLSSASLADERHQHAPGGYRADGFLLPTAPVAPLAERLAQPFPAPGLTMLVRRGVFDRGGLFRAERAHSYAADWLLRAREQGAVIDEDDAVLVRRRLHAGNRSRHLTNDSRDEFLLLLKEHLDRRRRGGN